MQICCFALSLTLVPKQVRALAQYNAARTKKKELAEAILQISACGLARPRLLRLPPSLLFLYPLPPPPVYSPRDSKWNGARQGKRGRHSESRVYIYVRYTHTRGPPRRTIYSVAGALMRERVFPVNLRGADLTFRIPSINIARRDRGHAGILSSFDASSQGGCCYTMVWGNSSLYVSFMRFYTK